MILDSDSRGRLILKSPYSFRHTAAKIPSAKWVKELKAWRYQPRVSVYRSFEKHLKDIQMTRRAKMAWAQLKKSVALQAQKDDRLKVLVKQAQKIKGQRVVKLNVPLKSKLRQFQKKAVAVGLNFDASALLMEQGTGKTICTIAVAGQRHVNKQVDKLLVGGPVSVMEVWGEELEKHAKFPYEFKIVNTKTFHRAWSIGQLFSDRKKPLKICAVNYESLWRIEELIREWQPSMAVLDESQRIKKHTSRQARACHRMNKYVPFRMILSGTPVPQSPQDVFSQYKFLNPDIFGTVFSDFQNRYVRLGGYMRKKIVGYRNLKGLSRRAHSIAFRVTKKEALDLPKVTYQNRYFELKSSKPYYEDIKNKLVTVVDGKKISTKTLLTKIKDLQQISAGFIKTEKGYVKVGHEKLDLLQEILEDLPRGKKVIIFARFLFEIKMISELLRRERRSFMVIKGGIKDRKQLIRDFQKKKDPQIGIIQIQSGGVGITLTAADLAIFYSVTFSSSDYEQAKARIHRIGQKSPVTYIHLIGRNTIDRTIINAVRRKKKLADLVVDQLNPHANKYLKSP